jgi:hypothetical protein
VHRDDDLDLAVLQVLGRARQRAGGAHELDGVLVEHLEAAGAHDLGGDDVALAGDGDAQLHFALPAAQGGDAG